MDKKKDVNAESKKQCSAKVDFPKVVIFVASEKERDLIVKPALEKLGLFGRSDIWSVVTGVGKVNAALSASMLISTLGTASAERVHSVLCVNVGVCGGNAVASEKYPTAQINEVVNNDFYIGGGENSDKRDSLTITDVVADMRVCYSQDHLCVDLNELHVDCDEPCYVDSELYSIAAACANHGVRVCGLKSVSNVVGTVGQIDLRIAGFEKACVRASSLLYRYLSNCKDVVLK